MGRVVTLTTVRISQADAVSTLMKPHTTMYRIFYVSVIAQESFLFCSKEDERAPNHSRLSRSDRAWLPRRVEDWR